MEDTAATAPAAANAPAPAPRSIGARLRAGRERSGVSIAATAEKLHLDPKVIEALEADRFAELGASVYVKGHLRRYADFVGEAGAELVDMYTAREVRPPPPDLTQIPQAERRADPRRLVTPLVGLGAALVLALAIYWVLGASSAGSGAANPPAAPAKAATAPVANSPAARVPAPGTPLPAPAPTVAAAEPTAAPADAAAEQPRKEEPAPARTVHLRLELASDSWIEIKDARGQNLFLDVASAGTVQTVSGRPPLQVELGNALGVSIEVNGQKREIPASAIQGEAARFFVNRSGSLSRAP